MAKTNYVPSVNILRDGSRSMAYIPTPNGKRVANQLVDDFKKGLRAFNLIGSYGTGKSAFLLALEQSLAGTQRYFDVSFVPNAKVATLKLIGEYRSIVDAFAERFGLSATKSDVNSILHEVHSAYHDLGPKGLLIVEIDEFGKFLEYASQNDAEKELYFIQQLAELAGNPDWNIVLITTIHQGFESYAYGLTAAQRQEWTKVKGRFREITFNEPVEQLLYLAAEHINELHDGAPSKTALDKSFALFKQSKAFNYTEQYAREIYKQIYPLDILAANVLTLSLQRYGQNERSLFSFLESTDHTGLAKFRKAEQPFYNLASVFEYLSFNFYHFLGSKYNPDFAAWASIRTALEVAERAFDENVNEYHKLIKSLGLLNIFAAGGAVIDGKFLEGYAQTCLGIAQPSKLIQQLAEKKIIRFRKHSQRYVLYDGTDLDIETALIEAGDKVSEITDIPTLLKKHFDFKPVLTKSYSFETGTPRYFQYVFSEVPVNPNTDNETDGFINLVFSDSVTIDAVKEFSAKVEDAVLYGFYQNAKAIKDLLYEIKKTQKVLDENKDDKVAKKELDSFLDAQQRLLNHYIVNNLYGAEGGVVWVYRGEVVTLDSKRFLNKKLSQICTQVYPDAPVFRNELVNRTKLSGSIYTAKKNFFNALVNRWNQQDLGFDAEKFPPEKTIYLTLLRENGLVTYSNSASEVGVNEDSTFVPLWDFCVRFLNRCRDGRRSIDDLVDALKRRPFGLRQGLVEIWVPTFLFLKRTEFALFSDEGHYLPELTPELLDQISRNPQDYSVKAFDVEGVKLDIFNSYRIFLNQEVQERVSTESFIETIKPFLTFYRQLPEYSKSTKRLSKDALAIKTAIARAQDPEKTFFEDFPAALGTSLSKLKDDKEALNAFTQSLQSAIREIRTSLTELVERVDSFIQHEIVGADSTFEDYKVKLQDRFRAVKRHLLLPHQRTFLQRIDSGLDDRQAWLNSVSQAVIDKPLDRFRDDDEILFKDKLQSLIFELDSLTKLSKANVDAEKEEVVGIQLETFGSGMQQNLVRIPKSKTAKVETMMDNLRNTLSRDNSVNLAALTRLLQELLSK